MIQSSLGVTQSQFVHILSHCPYLLAQYSRYKGRDLHATVMALLEVDSDSPAMIKDDFNADSEDKFDRKSSESESILEDQDNNFEKSNRKRSLNGWFP